MADQASGSGQPAGNAGGDSNQSNNSSRGSYRGRGRGRGRKGKAQSTPIRTRNNTHDPADPNELHDFMQSIEDRFEALRTEQQREQEDFQTRLLHSQDAIMQMLLDMRNRDGLVPDHPRDAPDLTTSTPPTLAEQPHGTASIRTSRAPHDEVHPSIENEFLTARCARWRVSSLNYYKIFCNTSRYTTLDV
jgi:hypothetical protein